MIERLVRSIALRYLHLGVWGLTSQEDRREMLLGDTKLQLDLGVYLIHPQHLEEIQVTVDRVLQEFEDRMVPKA